MARHLILALAVLAMAILAAPLQAREGDWVLLGQAGVVEDDERDIIEVGREDGRFSRLRLDVQGADVFLRSMTIVFSDRSSQVVSIGAQILPGQPTPPIDLNGPARQIRSIVLNYRPKKSSARRATVMIYGERPSAGGPDRSDRFETIAEETYDRRADRIVFRVNPRAGRVAKIQFRSLDDPIVIETVQVRYQNGETQNINVYDRVGPGESSQPIDLEGERRLVDQVTVWKRPSWRPGEGRLELLGLSLPRFDGPRGAGPGADDVIAGQTYERRDDRIVMRVDPRAGRVSQIALRAVDDGLSFQGVQVRFANGETQSINAYGRLSPGEQTEPIDVRGDRRGIVEVVVFKRPSWRPGTARIELIGLGRARPPLGADSGAVPPGWVLFGAQRVGLGVDRDVIEIGPEIGRFERIALRVLDADVFLREITIVYANGDRDAKDVYTEIPANSRTRPIELKGDRFIQRIELVYQAQPDRRGGRAIVEVYGDYARGWLGSDRGGYQGYNKGWLMLGAQRAQIFSTDRDAFVVGDRFGPFRALRLVVRRHAVRVMGVRIVYGNGQTEDVPIFTELLDGQSTVPIDLRRRERFIARVEVRYRTKLNFNGEGIVELWGLR